MQEPKKNQNYPLALIENETSLQCTQILTPGQMAKWREKKVETHFHPSSAVCRVELQKLLIEHTTPVKLSQVELQLNV